MGKRGEEGGVGGGGGDVVGVSEAVTQVTSKTHSDDDKIKGDGSVEDRDQVSDSDSF